MNAERISIDVRGIGEYRLTVEVGDPLSPDGLTRLVLEGHGELHAEQVYAELSKDQGGEFDDRTGPPERACTGKIDKPEAERLLKTASQIQWDRKFPPRPGIPDEAIVEWQLGKSDEPGLSMKTWIQDAEKDPNLGPLFGRLREELARISEDQLYF